MASLASSKPHPHLLDAVLVEDNSFSKTLILNRPKQLNALYHQMVSRLFELFLAYEKDPNVRLLLLKSFCAGDDVAAVVRDIREGFAMPETALGLFPDVGASYFLSRLPGFFDLDLFIRIIIQHIVAGEYLGLTGATLDGAEMLKLLLLEEALVNLDSSDPARISAIIDEYSERPYLKGKSAYHRAFRSTTNYYEIVVANAFDVVLVEQVDMQQEQLETSNDSVVSNTSIVLSSTAPTPSSPFTPSNIVQQSSLSSMPLTITPPGL
ncbi:hypothetical protein NC651_032839 [Populus alba x Populus x berolinensis]|nr:hypothetical protein NC651_032839 [Populus alba x Populus x berolinensis]